VDQELSCFRKQTLTNMIDYGQQQVRANGKNR